MYINLKAMTIDPISDFLLSPLEYRYPQTKMLSLRIHLWQPLYPPSYDPKLKMTGQCQISVRVHYSVHMWYCAVVARQQREYPIDIYYKKVISSLNVYYSKTAHSWCSRCPHTHTHTHINSLSPSPSPPHLFLLLPYSWYLKRKCYKCVHIHIYTEIPIEIPLKRYSVILATPLIALSIQIISPDVLQAADPFSLNLVEDLPPPITIWKKCRLGNQYCVKHNHK